MSDVIVLDKSKVRQLGIFLLASALALAAVYVVKRKLPKGSPFEVASIETADANHPADRDTVILKDGTKLTNIGFQLKFHGALAHDPDHGALILSGMECQDCAAIESLLVQVLPESRTIQLPYPGQVYDPPSGDRTEGDLSLESRVFYGECLEEVGPALLIYRNERDPGGNFKASLSVMSFREDGSFQETAREEAPYQIGELMKAAEKHCTEIAGKTFRH